MINRKAMRKPISKTAMLNEACEGTRLFMEELSKVYSGNYSIVLKFDDGTPRAIKKIEDGKEVVNIFLNPSNEFIKKYVTSVEERHVLRMATMIHETFHIKESNYLDYQEFFIKNLKLTDSEIKNRIDEYKKNLEFNMDHLKKIRSPKAEDGYIENLFEEAKKNEYKIGISIARGLGNSAEDGRIEYLAKIERPKYKGYIDFSNNSYMDYIHIASTENRVYNLIMGFCSLCVANRHMRGIRTVDSKIYSSLEMIRPYIRLIRQSPTTRQALRLVEKVIKKIYPLIHEIEESASQEELQKAPQQEMIPKLNNMEKEEDDEECNDFSEKESQADAEVESSEYKDDDGSSEKGSSNNELSGLEGMPPASTESEDMNDNKKEEYEEIIKLAKQDINEIRNRQLKILKSKTLTETEIATSFIKQPEYLFGDFEYTQAEEKAFLANQMSRDCESQVNMLTKALKKIFQPKHNYAIKRRKSGTFDSTRLLPFVTMLNTDIFERRNNPSKELSFAFKIMNDSSGSTRDIDVEIVQCSYILSQALTNMKLPCKVISYEADSIRRKKYYQGRMTTDSNLVIHNEFKDWEEKSSRRISGFRSSGGNADGLSIRVSGAELSQRKEDVKILFVISDGRPVHRTFINNLGLDQNGVDDTKLAVEEIRKEGVIVIGIYVGDNLAETARSIYGANCICINKNDSNNLAQKVSNTLKQELRKIKNFS